MATLAEATTWLHEHALAPFLEETRSERLAEIERLSEHVELSLTELLQRADEEIGRAQEAVERGEQGAEGRLAQAEARHAELLERRERRRKELERQRALSLQAVERIASVLVLPHPERERPEVQQRRPRGAARGAQGTALAPLCGRLPALRPKEGRLHPPTGVRTATARTDGVAVCGTARADHATRGGGALPDLAPASQGSACQIGQGEQVGPPWHQARGVLWTGVHRYGRVQTGYGHVHNEVHSIQTEARHMIPKGCKRLADAEFPIAEVSRHAGRIGLPYGRRGQVKRSASFRSRSRTRPGLTGTRGLRCRTIISRGDALAKPMQVREESPPHGEEK